MKKLILLALGFVNLAVLLCNARAEKGNGSLVYFRSGDTTLAGYVYRPEGNGPFPAVVYVRVGNKLFSETEPPVPELGKFFTGKGFVLFVPMHRSNEDLRAEVEGVQAKLNQKKNRAGLTEYAVMTKDVAAAVTWVKSQSYVNENRVAVSGQGSGAVAALLLSQQEVGVSGYIVFSPASQAWSSKPAVQQALLNAVKESKAPIFLLQPQNDFTLEPSQFLGRDVAAKGAPSLAKVYSPFGTTHEQSVGFAAGGSNVWGNDVTRFLESVFNL
jgi:carboxymethylenebutenolidase